jgi:DNA modification methylase
MTGLNLDTIECADVMDYLRGLPDACVNLVCTSPPYFNLRDYGTAAWDGGDPACDHRTGRFQRGGLSEKQSSNHGSSGDEARAVCGKCGARRIDQQIGLEATPAAYVARMVDVFREVRRVLRPDGNVYVNLGDSYTGSGRGPTGHNGIGSQETRQGFHSPQRTEMEGYMPKSLMLIPHRFAIAMQDDGWLLREDIVWQKPNPMPESVRDRCTRSHEYIFHFTKSPRYWYDAQAVAEPTSEGTFARALRGVGTDHKNADGAPGQNRNSIHRPREHGEGYPINPLRNRRSVWTINPANFREAHFATFPEDIPEICIKAACPEGGVVLDFFMGAGTVGLVAKKLNRRYIGCDLNADYVRMAEDRINGISYTLFSLMEVASD